MKTSHLTTRLRRYAPRMLWYPVLLLLCFLNWYFLPAWGPLMVIATCSVLPVFWLIRWVIKPALIEGKPPSHFLGLKLTHAGLLISLAGILLALLAILPFVGLRTFPLDYFGYLLIPLGMEFALWAWEAAGSR